jgi:hypothetical protein
MRVVLAELASARVVGVTPCAGNDDDTGGPVGGSGPVACAVLNLCSCVSTGVRM